MSETKERKPAERHPSTLIPSATVEEIAYLVYLRRLEPPMTQEASVAKTVERDGKVVTSDALRRTRSKSMLPLLRDVLAVLVDMGMVVP